MFRYGGVILKSDPDNIRKITKTGTGIAPILTSELKSNTINYTESSATSDSTVYLLSKHVSSNYYYTLIYYGTVPELALNALNTDLSKYKGLTISRNTVSNYDIDSNINNVAVLIDKEIRFYDNQLSSYNIYTTNITYNKIMFNPSNLTEVFLLSDYRIDLFNSKTNVLTKIAENTSTPHKYTKMLVDKKHRDLYVINSNNYCAIYSCKSGNATITQGIGIYNINSVSNNDIIVVHPSNIKSFYYYYSWGSGITSISTETPINENIEIVKSVIANNKILFLLYNDGRIVYLNKDINGYWRTIIGEYKLDYNFGKNTIMDVDEANNNLLISYSHRIYRIKYGYNLTNYAIYD